MSSYSVDNEAAIRAAAEAIEALDRFLAALGEDWLDKHQAKLRHYDKTRECLVFLKFAIGELSAIPYYLSDS